MSRIIHRVVVVMLAAISLLPFAVLVAVSLSSPSSALAGGIGIGFPLEPSNYREAAQRAHFGTAMLNSFILTASSLALLVLLASSAGYAIGRFPTRLNRFIFFTLLLFMMVPGIINTVPLYSLMRSIRGINSRWAMVLLLAANALPFSVFLYTGFVASMGREVEESAVVDGCTWFSAFWRVTWHFIKPVTAAVVIINGVGIWNNYGQAVFFLQRTDVRTIPLAVSLFFQKYGARWNWMAAAATLGVLPAAVAFLVFQKQFIKGIVSGAVKG